MYMFLKKLWKEVICLISSNILNKDKKLLSQEDELFEEIRKDLVGLNLRTDET